MREKGKSVLENELEERVRLSMLYDFYGALLKENQRRMYEAYILEDYSITEIAEEMEITRQGVHDAVKRATKQLGEYEERLGLVQRFERQRGQVRQLQECLKEMEISQETQEGRRVFEILQDILED